MMTVMKRWGLTAALLVLWAGHGALAESIGVSVGTDPFISNTALSGAGSLQEYVPANMAYGPTVANPGVAIPGGGFSFTLPDTVGTGDVAIDDSMGKLVGLLRFGTDGTHGGASNIEELFGPGQIPMNFNPVISITLAPNGTGQFDAGGTNSPSADNFYNVSGFPPAAVPEPSSLILMGVSGLGGVGYSLSRRKRAAARA